MAGAVLAMAGAGCASGSRDDGAAPVSAIADGQAPSGTRMRAVRRAWAAAEAGESDRGAVRESLKKLAWSRSAWHGLRTAALEELLADEPNLGDTQNMMRLMLPLETQWPVVEFICAAASERGWRGMTASLVRSWSRAVPSPADAERPERAALAALHPELDAPEIAWRTFTGEAWGGPELRDRDRRDAWALLARIDPRGERIVALARASAGGGNIAGDPLVDAVTIAARDLGAVPTSSEQLRWVERWRQPEQRAWWDEASRAIAALSDGQRVGLGLRHAALARWAAEHAPTWLTSDRSALLEELERALEGRRTVTRTSDSTAGAGGSPASGSLRAFSERASWGDAGLALVAVRAPQKVAYLPQHLLVYH